MYKVKLKFGLIEVLSCFVAAGDAERDADTRDAGEDGKRRSKKHKKHHKKEKRDRSSRRDASPPRPIPDEPQQPYPQDRRYGTHCRACFCEH